MSDSHRIDRIYRRIGFITCSSVFLLFLFGGLVRATGSGMGCPDWPRCFGLWAPPTCDCDLPANYEQLFLEKRLAKVKRFAQTLERFGLNQQAQTLRENPYVDLPEKFDPIKAWIEYINRLFGVFSVFAATPLCSLHSVTRPSLLRDYGLLPVLSCCSSMPGWDQ